MLKGTYSQVAAAEKESGDKEAKSRKQKRTYWMDGGNSKNLKKITSQRGRRGGGI